MSAICIIDYTSSVDKIGFEKCNKMAKEIIKYCLEYDLAAFFNSYDYGKEIIVSAGMKAFFLMSDSFLYKNCEFLHTSDCGIVESNADLDFSKDQFKSDFIEKFSFLKYIINIISKYNIESVDIYLSGGNVEDLSEFDKLPANYNNFLEILCDYIVVNADKYAYEFPDVKLELLKT